MPDNADDRLWRPMVVLPNLEIHEAIYAGPAAFLTMRDDRMRAVATAHPNFAAFLGRFTDAFGQRVSPTILALAPDAAESYRTREALAGLRDCLVMSVVPYAWARALQRPQGSFLGTLYSDGLAFYPWMLDNKFEDLMASTPASMAIHLVKQFKGQTAPAIMQVRPSDYDLDQWVLDRLIEAWRRRYRPRRATWRDTALFRSLNMANQASRQPALSDTTVYDIGRNISLWVSAFEILNHPGPNGRSDLGGVLDLIEAAPWAAPKLRARRYTVIRARSGTKARKGGLPLHVFRKLYDLRNDFLHGNPISLQRLRQSPHRLWSAYAPLLYRMALAGFLNQEQPAGPPSLDPDDIAARIAARLADEVRTFESALLTGHGPRAKRRG